MALTQKWLAGRDSRSGKRRDATPGRWADGNKLFLKVTTAGRRYWTVRLKLRGRDTELSIGTYPAMAIETARLERDRLVGDAAGGKHPRGGWRASAAPSKASPTFGEIAERYINAREGAWGRRHAVQWRTTIRDYCVPILDVPVPNVTTLMVIDILGPIWSTKVETARRLRGKIEAVLAAGYVLLDLEEKANPTRWRGWLDKSLPKHDRSTSRNHPALPAEDMPNFMARLRALEGVSARCLEFTALTAVRTANARLAKWSEIDVGRRVWEIPGHRMKVKTKTPFRVPLSEAAIALLERCRRDVEASEFVFFVPTSRKPLSSEAMRQFLHRMRVNATVHGFRATFATWAQNEGMPRDLREMSLAHVAGDRTKRAYARGEAFKLRAFWMARWGEYCSAAPPPTALLPAPVAKLTAPSDSGTARSRKKSG
jgi:integrase